MASPEELQAEVRNIETAAANVPYETALETIRSLGFAAACEQLEGVVTALNGHIGETARTTSVCWGVANNIQETVINPLKSMHESSNSAYVEEALGSSQEALNDIIAANDRLRKRFNKILDTLATVRGLMESLSEDEDIEKNNAAETVENSRMHSAKIEAPLEEYLRTI